MSAVLRVGSLRLRTAAQFYRTTKKFAPTLTFQSNLLSTSSSTQNPPQSINPPQPVLDHNYASENFKSRWLMAVPAFCTHMCIGSPWAWSLMADMATRDLGMHILFSHIFTSQLTIFARFQALWPLLQLIGHFWKLPSLYRLFSCFRVFRQRSWAPGNLKSGLERPWL